SMGFMAFLSATTLAIDVGMLMTARTQTQTSADAGALAGATALAFDDFNNRSSTGPAVQSAINAALANQVVGAAVSINSGDVTFVNDSFGVADRVQVKVFRTAARGNPIQMMMGVVFGMPTADISASAVAEMVPANADTCVKPWALPDKWQENQTPPWSPTVTFNDHPLSPTLRPDVFTNATQPTYTGYSPSANTGLTMTISPTTGNGVANGYTPVDLPGSSGAANFETNIDTCNTDKVSIGDTISAEPLNMNLSTQTGVNDLIAKDPGAHWDSVNQKVVSSMNPSPRVVVIPLYDPKVYQDTQRSTGTPQLQVVDFMGFFITNVDSSGNVTGVVVPVTGLVTGTAQTPQQAFGRAIRLVQ
ncbi:MAG TPA: pilus assembly protein TadG-related protein, partial [Vicinamibacterales bacterium]|nr:pilus assembly protein TadG-related protein [Vicinamibacterales bacterium]